MLSQAQQSAAFATAVAARTTAMNAQTAAAVAAAVPSLTLTPMTPAESPGNGRMSFTFPSPPRMVFKNGALYGSGDYTLNGSIITFTYAPAPSDIIVGY